MCLYPKIIRNRKYTSNKKNNGIVPEIKDKRTEYVPVGCGKCMECKKQKSRAWAVRLQEEIKENKNGVMVTLTFTDEEIVRIEKEIPQGLEPYENDNEVATWAVRHFLERWRKKYNKSVKHWLVTELGHQGTERIHLHGIIFTDHKEEIQEKWKHGYVWMGKYVNMKTVNYIIKYVNKIDKDHPGYNQKVLCSPGIGSRYIGTRNQERNKYNDKKTLETYVTREGVQLNLPIYYRNKIYSDEERERLWIKKLDEGIRYVNGIKCTTDEQYYAVLKYQQARNVRLGYGTDEIEWSKKKYERDRRNLIKQERIKKIKENETQQQETAYKYDLSTIRPLWA
ncbi:MAG: replication initiator protein [Microviridae sp.]|nr:MAG: replication initiator protein [Microviridae sp.]